MKAVAICITAIILYGAYYVIYTVAFDSGCQTVRTSPIETKHTSSVWTFDSAWECTNNNDGSMTARMIYTPPPRTVNWKFIDHGGGKMTAEMDLQPQTTSNDSIWPFLIW